MKILTVDNKTYELDDIPEVVDDLRYGVLDYSNPKNVDYYFYFPFRESFIPQYCRLVITYKHPFSIEP